MTRLADHRATAAALLTAAGLPAHGHVPDRLVPPAAFVEPAEPYLLPGPTFGHYTARLQVTVVVAGGTNDRAADELDALITTAVTALDGADFDVEEVSAPFGLIYATTTYPAARLTITTTTEIGD